MMKRWTLLNWPAHVQVLVVDGENNLRQKLEELSYEGKCPQHLRPMSHSFRFLACVPMLGGAPGARGATRCNVRV